MSQELKIQLCKMSIQEKVAGKAKEWADEKVKYRHRGVTRTGCDCSGLLIGIMRELGYLKNFIYPVYPLDWNLHGFVKKHNYITEYIGKYANQIEKETKQPGDILLFKYVKVICHTGIYIGHDLFVHSVIGSRVRYGTLKNSPYSHRLIEVWRIDETRIN